MLMIFMFFISQLSFILPLIEKLKLENQSESYRQAPKVGAKALRRH